jgi:predicted nucleotidyltransferase component of viral defense system
MSDEDPQIVDIKSWVARARRDKPAYLERQAIEIVLSAIGAMPGYGSHIFLKGGILMAVVYKSPRGTVDLDFSTDLRPTADLPDQLRKNLDLTLPRLAAQLGYPDLVLRVQTIKEQPRAFGEGASFPALEVKIAYARRDTPGERRFLEGKAANVIALDVSFNEPVQSTQFLRLSIAGPTIAAYALTDLIAEKLRALLQQVTRNRYRRQDVYDIAHLIERFPLNDEERRSILESFILKCKARDIVPSIESISDPEVVTHARSEWETIKQELGTLPDFESCFAKVDALYRSLPWRTR